MRNMRRMIGPALLIAGVVALVSTSAVAQRGERAKPQVAELRAKPQKRVTQQQRESAQARIELATAIVNRFDAEAQARGLNAGWRQPAYETLLPLSQAQLERVAQQAVSLDALAPAIAEATDDPNLLGDPDADLVYTPIAPCRFIDTRFYAAGPISGTRSFDLDVTGATYGGSGACNPTVSLGASGDVIGAIAANLTIVGPAVAPGFLAVKPTAASPLSSLLNWYEAGASVQVANAGIFQTANGVNNFVIQTSASTDVIMDILGAFIEPEATALQITETNASVVVPPNTWDSITAPVCPAGYAQTATECGTSAFLNFITDLNNGFCGVRNNSAANITLNAWRVCARVPGR